MKKVNTEQFIEKANRIHNNKYTYEKTVYTTVKNKIIITCPIHGDFLQVPNQHLDKSGCAKCKFDKIGNIKRKDVNILKTQFSLVHGDKYNYDKVEYINAKAKIIVTCPIHGDFKICPDKHSFGQGCPLCSRRLSSAERKITDILTNVYGIKHTYDKKFDGLLGDRHALRFDFYLEDLHLLIEYDGIQHTDPKWMFRCGITSDKEALEKFTKNAEYDYKKYVYAYNNNIPLLRINHTHRSFESLKKIIYDFLRRNGHHPNDLRYD